MIGRRAFFRALVAIPVAAKVAAEAAEKEVLGMSDVSGVEPPSVVERTDFPAEWSALQEAQRKLWREREIADRLPEHMPPHISTKKSWSPAFKQSVFAAEMRERSQKDNLLSKLMHDNSLQGRARRAALRVFGIDIAA